MKKIFCILILVVFSSKEIIAKPIDYSEEVKEKKKSKRKFPIAETIPDIGIRGKNAHSAIDNVIARNDFLNRVNNLMIHLKY